MTLEKHLENFYHEKLKLINEQIQIYNGFFNIFRPSKRRRLKAIDAYLLAIEIEIDRIKKNLAMRKIDTDFDQIKNLQTTITFFGEP